MHDIWSDETEPGQSKSQRKREMLELQAVGERLLALSEQQLADFPLSEDLRKALSEYHRISKHEARRRQMQYIGRLMRSEDHEGIAAAFERIDQERRRSVQQEKLADEWRKRLLEGSADVVTEFVDAYPHTDRQALRQLVRNAVAENKAGKPCSQSRKLFRLIRTILADHQN